MQVAAVLYNALLKLGATKNFPSDTKESIPRLFELSPRLLYGY